MCLPTIVMYQPDCDTASAEVTLFKTFGEAVTAAEGMAQDRFPVIVYVPVRKISAEKITKVEFISGAEDFTKGIYNGEGEKIA